MATVNVGQQVYLEPLGNAARRSSEIITANVTKVGRKYFEVDWYGKFFLDSMVQENGGYSPNYKVYTDKNEILDRQERDFLFSQISTHFRYSNNLTLEQLKNIMKIITEC